MTSYLEKISRDKRFKELNFGLYRDDGLAVHGRLPGKIETIRKELHVLFKQHGLKILMEGKSTTRVDFLDITLDLAKEKFLPYRKPNDVPLYIHVGSNFKAAAPEYQRALDASGHKYNLKRTTANPNETPRNPVGEGETLYGSTHHIMPQ